MTMKIKFLGHSSLIIRTEATGILCDPWLSGRVFNNSWGLSPPPQFAPGDLRGVDYLWISHEHPDHLHFPSLASLPTDFKSRVTVLFQRNNSHKVGAALAKNGYRNFVAVPHNTVMPLGSGGDSCAIYQHRHLDSALIVSDVHGTRIVNENDAELTQTDCAILRRKFGAIDVLFKQFSIAGFDGLTSRIAAAGEKIITSMTDHHRWLGAAVTCPIASFMYFCRPDNQHLNAHANSALDVKRAFDTLGLNCHLMYPGAERTVEEMKAAPGDIEEFERFYRQRAEQIDPLETAVPIQDIAAALKKTVAAWHAKFPSLMVNRIGAIPVRCLDHGQTYRLDFRSGELSVTSNEPLVEINSQPLLFAFSVPFGIQTLGVSGRYRLARLTREWKLVRVLSSLFNAEIYLRPRYLFSREMLGWLRARRAGLGATVWQQVRRFRQESQ
jgi:hypothetical protein